MTYGDLRAGDLLMLTEAGRRVHAGLARREDALLVTERSYNRRTGNVNITWLSTNGIEKNSVNGSVTINMKYWMLVRS